jgi:hypothetical protein
MKSWKIGSSIGIKIVFEENGFKKSPILKSLPLKRCLYGHIKAKFATQTEFQNNQLL